jgi:hypothetical protein
MGIRELIKDCEDWYTSLRPFSWLVGRAVPILGTSFLAVEFEVAETTVSHWADGTAVPHPRIQAQIVSFIQRQALKKTSAVTSIQLAKEELLRQCRLRVLADFDQDVLVMHEDGSTFFVRNALTGEWVDPLDSYVWVFLFAEHNEPMYWHADDLIYWGIYPQAPCANCEGMGVVPNRMCLPEGPMCGCGKPSVTQSGNCGTNCDPTCTLCGGKGRV